MASLRDRILTPAGARAVTAPAAIVAAGAGVALGVVVGAPVVAAAALGAVAWVGTVAARLPRPAARPTVDPSSVPEPWRRYVLEAVDASARFSRVVQGARVGPLRQRLGRIADRIDTGVAEVSRIAAHGASLDAALRELDAPAAIEERIEAAEAELARGDDDGRGMQVVAALRSQLASVERIAATAEDTRRRLQLLDARLDEAVARAVELSLGQSGDPAGGAVGGLDDDVDAIVTEMEALRLALEDTARA
ncbi:MAG: hypothetical protein ACLGIR_02620 [Actinomycetes bacterium]